MEVNLEGNILYLPPPLSIEKSDSNFLVFAWSLYFDIWSSSKDDLKPLLHDVAITEDQSPVIIPTIAEQQLTS